MSYAYFFEGENIASALFALLGGIPSGLFGIASYVLTSLALYVIARRRAIQKAWLSWIPVLNCWIWGSLSDQYRYVVKGQIRAKRKWLLVLNLASFVLSTAVLFRTVGALFDVLRYGEFAKSFLDSLLGLVGLAVPLALTSISFAVLRFMALYDVYVSVDPHNAVLFLVLSILIPIVEPFFLFFNRDKDTGMPPRRDTIQEPTWEQENKDFL